MDAKLLIIADLGVVKAYKLDRTSKGSPHVEMLEQVRLEQAHHRWVETVTDFAGRRAAPTQRRWGAPTTDAHNLERETERRLIKEVVNHIQRLAQGHQELPIWLAAPKEVNHLVVHALPTKVRARVQVNLSRDLVKADQEQLLESFTPAMAAAAPK